jgi:hypothetical protein
MVGDVNLKLRLIDRLQFNGPDDKDITLSDLAPSYFNRLSYLVDEMRVEPFLVQLLLRYNDFVIHEFGILDRKMDWSIIEHEFGEIDRKSLGKWNLILLEILDEEKVLPPFAIELLT